ncbi:DUF2937 family protein [Salipiger abyssi]|uniref:Putative DUF2937 protein n=1 Tax=Salipiger abyssi TaxID=1250539 RepID=A0A1P8UQM3_9RHOB|nr:DUF2937 family protein [Salipiger abyssi]APZ51628.1 putative DUF2937 protein [Salipiger abyssi]
MITRALALAAGVTGAVGLSQVPEFTQQYVQRLGGAVDELSRQIAEFDADAGRLGFARDAALEQLATGGAFGAARADSMTRTIARHDRLAADLAALDGRGAFERLTGAAHFSDPEIAERTWQAFRPALPATPEGLVFAGMGFAGGWLAAAALLALLYLPFRRRGPRAGSAPRSEPPLHRARPVTPSGPVLRASRDPVRGGR